MAHASTLTLGFGDAARPAGFVVIDQELDLGLVPSLRVDILNAALAMALAPRGAAMVRRLEA